MWHSRAHADPAADERDDAAEDLEVPQTRPAGDAKVLEPASAQASKELEKVYKTIQKVKEAEYLPDSDEETLKLQEKKQKTIEKQMREYLLKVDFCQEFNLKRLLENEQVLDKNEQKLSSKDWLRLVKVLYYKVGLAFKHLELLEQKFEHKLEQKLSRLHDLFISNKDACEVHLVASQEELAQQKLRLTSAQSRLTSVESLLALHDEALWLA